MPNIKVLLFTFFCVVFVAFSSYSMVFDNRALPLFQRPRLSIDGKQSFLSIDYFMATASAAIGQNDSELGLPEISGLYNQKEHAKAFVATGRPNPLRSDWQAFGKIPWRMNGKFQAQGLAFAYYQSLCKWFGFGASWLFMRTNTSLEFKLQEGKVNIPLGPGDVRELDDRRRQMFTDIGISENHAGEIGFGDIDLYGRIGGSWDYALKFRRIDAGFRLGVLFPSGVTNDINSPGSIPFGGDGHWGVYGAIDGLFELREDLKAGFLLRVSKRFENTKIRRMPALKEPSIFGTIVGSAKVDPGITGIFSPYLAIENLRDGLGALVQYTLTSHAQDNWKDARADQSVPTNLTKVQECSKWSSDYFTLGVFYDFGKMKVTREFDPILSFRWDVPSLLLTSSRIFRTHKLSIGIEFDF